MAKKNLKDLEKIKSNFLMVASHQLKTPLNIIRLNLEMVLNGDLGRINKQVRDNLVEVAKMDIKALELVNDFLNAAALDTKKKISSNPEIDIVRHIKSIIGEMRILARQHDIRIVFVSEPANLKAAAKVNHFDEVFRNLLSNAIKYNRVGGNVEVKLQQSANDFVLSIRDEGIGIDPADQKRLFSKFFRADNAIKKATEGSGLGLYIVKSYILGWDGQISCQSQKNKGTVFTVTIPRKQQ